MQDNLQEWMLDKRGRDQFVIRYGDETEIFWNDAARSQVRPTHARVYTLGTRFHLRHRFVARCQKNGFGVCASHSYFWLHCQTRHIQGRDIPTTSKYDRDLVPA